MLYAMIVTDMSTGKIVFYKDNLSFTDLEQNKVFYRNCGFKVQTFIN